jgi:hypothetical protein
MNTSQRKVKRLATILGALQVFIGLGAVGGGLALVLDPSGANLGIPLELLNNSPFSNYFIPGIVLMLVNGIGSLAGGVASFTRYRCAGEIAMALGAFLLAWIIVQVWWIEAFHWLHAMYIILGLLEITFGWLLRRAIKL